VLVDFLNQLPDSSTSTTNEAEQEDRVHEQHRMLELLDGEGKSTSTDASVPRGEEAELQVRKTFRVVSATRCESSTTTCCATKQEDDVRAHHVLALHHHHRGDELDHEHRRRGKCHQSTSPAMEHPGGAVAGHAALEHRQGAGPEQHRGARRRSVGRSRGGAWGETEQMTELTREMRAALDFLEPPSSVYQRNIPSCLSQAGSCRSK
jgi:hypothetical protein